MKVGEVIDGKYMLTRQIGVGGMGSVWEGKALLDDRRVAIKSLHETLVEERELTARFLREARAALEARFSGHIIEVIEVVSGRGRPPYLVMEYLEGEDLLKILGREGRLEVGRAVELIIQTCEALDEVHRRGIIHRDIKPGNLFVTKLPDGTEWIKLLDFGVAKFSPDAPRKGHSITKFGYTLGTPDYMAPEQAVGTAKIDYRVDIYSTGVVLYQLLAGRLPYQSDNVQELMIRSVRGNPDPLGKLRPEVSAKLETVVAKAMAVEREDRYQSMFELAAALQPFRPKSRGRGIGGLSAATTVKEKILGAGASPAPDDEAVPTIQRQLDLGALGIAAPETVVDPVEPPTTRDDAAAPAAAPPAPIASPPAARRRPQRGRWLLWLVIGAAAVLVAAAAAIAIAVGLRRDQGGEVAQVDARPGSIVAALEAGPSADAGVAADAAGDDAGAVLTFDAGPDAAREAGPSADAGVAADAAGAVLIFDAAPDAPARPAAGGREPRRPAGVRPAQPRGAVLQALRALEPSVTRCLGQTSVPGRRVTITYRVSPDGAVSCRRIRPGLSRGNERCLRRAAETVRLQPTGGERPRDYSITYNAPL